MNLSRCLALLIMSSVIAGVSSSPLQAQWGFKGNNPIPEGVRVSLEPTKPTFFLGENILAHFNVENVGTEPLNISTGGDYRGAARHMRFIVTAQDSNGEMLSDPYPSTFSMGGLGGGSNIKTGETWSQTLSLIRYCRFEKAGVYRIRVQHDLGWKATPERPLPVAEAQIELKMPTPEEAQEIVTALENIKESYGTMGQKTLTPIADFTALNYPVYLPFLMERIDAGKLKFLDSVSGIETVDATRALVERLQSNPETSKAVAQVLARRLPSFSPSPNIFAPSAKAAQTALKQQEALVAASWRDEFRTPTREYARKALSSTERETLRNAASMLENIGTAEDLPFVMKALNTRIGLTVATPRWQAAGDNQDNQEGWQLQDDCLMLMRCGQALLSRGAVLPNDNSAATIAIQIHPEFTKISENQAPPQTKWLLHPIAFIRQLTLQDMAKSAYPPVAPIKLTPEVRALLPVLLKDSDVSVRAAACDLADKSQDKTLLPNVLQVLSTARSNWLIGYAERAAQTLGGRYEVWKIWANRLDEKDMLHSAIASLSTVLEGNKGHGWNGNISDEVAIPPLKIKWQKFLVANKIRLEQGKLFSETETAWPAGMFPKQFSR